MASQPNSSAIRRAAMYILHCWRICAFGELGLLVRPDVKLHARSSSHGETSRASCIADLLHRRNRAPTG